MGLDLYASIDEKAAADECIIINYPFVDGNKRTGYILMEAILRYGNKKITLNDDEVYQFVIDISTGKIRFDEIATLLKTTILLYEKIPFYRFNPGCMQPQ